MHKHEEGFSLILVAILLVVAAMAATTALQESTRDQFWNPRTENQKILAAAHSRLQQFQRANGYLPCPAAINTLPTASTFGEASNCGAAAVGGQVWEVNAGGGEMVRIGMLPTKTLGLPKEAAADSYGARLLYAVSKKLTDSATIGDGMGVITVNDAFGAARTTEATFVVLSHGEDGKGAYRYSVANSSACASSGAAVDQENCDYLTAGDALFVSSRMSLVAGANYYDDQVLWGEVVRAASVIPVSGCAAECAVAGLGETISDGSMCVGLSPSGGTMCAMPTDAPSSTYWNNGGGANYETGFNSVDDGQANTEGLAALTVGEYPYQAAVYCADLAELGHDDWYLPAQNEMVIMFANGVDTAASRYWTSTEEYDDKAKYVRASGGGAGGVGGQDKDDTASIRCVRKE